MGKVNDKRINAKRLFLTGSYSQKEIAELVGASEKSISEWKKEDGWDTLKESLLTTRENELRRMYKMLRVLNDNIDLSADLKIPIDSKQSDSLLKLTQAIKNLEIETSIAEKVDVGIAFINLVRKDDVELAKTISQWFDVFIKQSI